MSKGPYCAYVKQILTDDISHKISTELKANCQNILLELPKEVDIRKLNIDDHISFYLSSPQSEDGDIKAKEQKVVLIFKHSKDEMRLFRNVHGSSIENDWFYIYKGEKLLELDKLPKCINLLMGISPFYGKRFDLVKKALEILDLTQDPDTLDALFSMKPQVIYELLQDKVCLCSNDELSKLPSYVRDTLIEETYIPVQIADLLVSMKLNGADLENPYKRDLPLIFALATIHGTPSNIINEFMSGYVRL